MQNQFRILNAESPEDWETDGHVTPRNESEEQNGWGCTLPLLTLTTA